MAESEFILEIKNLKVHFPIYGGIFWRKIGKVYAVDGVSFKIQQGQTFGLVGESGCGKTTLGRAVLRLYEPNEGEVIFNGDNLLKLKAKELRKIRSDIQMIFQDPFESLNTRHTIGYILEEPFIIHGVGTSKERKEKVKELLHRFELPKDSEFRFPHEFSGGQRQRIGIARAIALNPKLIICDEPVSALDVSIQSQILNLLLDLQSELGLTYMFIAHDLAVVKHISDYIAVMYLGKIVEYADADTIYENSIHPYTKALISAIPVPDPNKKSDKNILQGEVPSPITPPKGCGFNTRCPHYKDVCLELKPELEIFENNHFVACHRKNELL
ncbi:MAG: ATP-binding cassette domain-containing protein [Desulfobacterales bacterium]|nr:ATP-binding cassette domain-containing protein [Desulfobacterales bacterium]